MTTCSVATPEDSASPSHLRISDIGVSASIALRIVVESYSTVSDPVISRSPAIGFCLRPVPSALKRSAARLLLTVTDPPRTLARVVVPDASAVVVGAVRVPLAMVAEAWWNSAAVAGG